TVPRAGPRLHLPVSFSEKAMQPRCPAYASPDIFFTLGDSMTTNGPLRGWYPDPSGAPAQRYFDGQQWTHYAPPPPSPADDRHQQHDRGAGAGDPDQRPQSRTTPGPHPAY